MALIIKRKRATQTGYTRLIELFVVTGVVTSFVIPIDDETNEYFYRAYRGGTN
jgi:hypothetical protein